MKYRFQYESEEDKDRIMNTNSDKYLIEIESIIEGDFLVFADEPLKPTKQIIYVTVPEEDYTNIKQRQMEAEEVLNLILLGGI